MHINSRHKVAIAHAELFGSCTAVVKRPSGRKIAFYGLLFGLKAKQDALLNDAGWANSRISLPATHISRVVRLVFYTAGRAQYVCSHSLILSHLLVRPPDF